MSPAGAVAAMHPVPDEPKSVLPPCSVLTTSQRTIKRSKKLPRQCKPISSQSKNKNAIGVRACDGVCSVLECAPSYQHCTCGQASARHVNGACNTPRTPKQHKNMTNKMGVASPTQGKRRQEKHANDIEGYAWIEEGSSKSKQLGRTALLLQ